MNSTQDEGDGAQEIEVMRFGLNAADELYDFRPTAGKYDEMVAEESAPKDAPAPVSEPEVGEQGEQTEPDGSAKGAEAKEEKTPTPDPASSSSTPPGKSKQPA